ncbi:MAG TPA: hypothetical protein VF756_01745 [Thermoanaerobaculia bacterium]
MRRTFLMIAMLLAVAGAIATTPRPAEAGPGGNCFDRCECGTGYRCCTFDGVTTCKPSGEVLCPQIACL